jgi:TetR/AcrR family transcriptional repressor of nem operon
MKEGVKQGTLALAANPDTEAEILMAAVHGAMISARVHHSVSPFKRVTAKALQRITSK